MLQNDSGSDKDINAQLAEQKRLLLEKKAQLEHIISTIETMEKSKDEDKWSYLIHLLNLLTDDEKVKEQYQNATNLEKRISLHDYSTGSQEWMEWIFDKMILKSPLTKTKHFSLSFHAQTPNTPGAA